jgi:glycine dehydrogenase subunit 2
MKGVPLIFEKSKTGKEGFRLNTPEVPEIDLFQTLGEDIVRDEVDLPEVSELDVIRHYTQLSRMNFGVDNGFYPLGSCTMKYNPKINEEVAAMPGFTQLHPYAPEELSQGTLEIMYHAQNLLAHITGMDYFTLQPAASRISSSLASAEMFILSRTFPLTCTTISISSCTRASTSYLGQGIMWILFL